MLSRSSTPSNRPAPFQTTLGPYDFWAIEYGYKPLPADPTQAAAELRAIAARSAEPAWRESLLAFFSAPQAFVERQGPATESATESPQ